MYGGYANECCTYFIPLLHKKNKMKNFVLLCTVLLFGVFYSNDENENYLLFSELMLESILTLTARPSLT